MKELVATALTVALAAPCAAESGLTITRDANRSVASAPKEHFTGNATVEMLFTPSEGSRASGGLVSFAVGARTNWHAHPLGQTLIVTAGVGRVQLWGGSIEEIRQGDVVRIPPNVRHWHGAALTSAMTHIAIQEALDGKTVEWSEPVTEAQHSASPTLASSVQQTQPTAAQRLMGDIAPKLAQLTDDVLFGDVWSRPGLARRDRSLVTVSALVAMNRPDQLRSHLALGQQNGLTETEIVEAITQLAFYSGWPSAVTAIGVAREVLRPKDK